MNEKLTEKRRDTASMRHFFLIFNAAQSLNGENTSICDRLLLFPAKFRHCPFWTNGQLTSSAARRCTADADCGTAVFCKLYLPP